MRSTCDSSKCDGVLASMKLIHCFSPPPGSLSYPSCGPTPIINFRYAGSPLHCLKVTHDLSWISFIASFIAFNLLPLASFSKQQLFFCQMCHFLNNNLLYLYVVGNFSSQKSFSFFLSNVKLVISLLKKEERLEGNVSANVSLMKI